MKIRKYLSNTIYVNSKVKKKDFERQVKEAKPEIIEKEDRTIYLVRDKGIKIEVMKNG